MEFPASSFCLASIWGINQNGKICLAFCLSLKWKQTLKANTVNQIPRHPDALKEGGFHIYVFTIRVEKKKTLMAEMTTYIENKFCFEKTNF